MAKRRLMLPKRLTLKITLVGAKPPIWRRVVVANDRSLGALHAVIQTAMGWGGGHLHHFEIGDEYYGDPEEGLEDVEDENRLMLDDVLRRPKERIHYLYDFGDSWGHDVLLERVDEDDPKAPPAVCIAGKRACPPDDCGGVWGYANLLQILANPEHEEHDEMMDWIGGEWDAEAFDIEQTNKALARLFKR